jgi:catechol 2,3-dioxygenase-like lactoylglutathione lyase family enzyme
MVTGVRVNTRHRGSTLGRVQRIPIKFENVGIAVRDLEATIDLFTDLGLTVLGRDTVSGEWTDTAVGLDGNHANIAMLQTPDGNGRLELFEYIHPDAIETEPTRPNEIGMHRIAFSSTTSTRPSRSQQARLPAARCGDLRGRLQTHVSPRPQRHPRDARRGAEEELTAGRRPG